MICCLPGCGEPAFTMLAGYALCRADYELNVNMFAQNGQGVLPLDAYLFSEILRRARRRYEQDAKWRN